jgi:hypothetical protein
MKTLYLYLLLIAVSIYSGCKREEPPTIPVVATTTVTDLTGSSATCGGNITSDGRSAVIGRGVCWSMNAMPAITDSRTLDGYGTGSYSSVLYDLSGCTIYHVRAYATNSIGTAYGKDITFTTPGQAPTATTEPATNISENTALLNGTVNANYLSTAVIFEYGTTASYGNAVSAFQSLLSGDSTTNVSANISGLATGRTYHFRVKAENSAGMVSGDDIIFTTLLSVHAPVVSTNAATNRSQTGATLNGTVNANGLSTTVTFEYDSSATSYGSAVTAFQSPVTGDSITNVSADISGLTLGGTYHFRVKAENSDGVSYGDDIQLTLFTCDQVPEVSTLGATNITTSAATLNGNVIANNWPTTVTFTYLRGIHMGRSYYQTVNAVPDTVRGDSITHVSAFTSGFGRGPKTSQFWVTATNACGTIKGNVLTFTRP